MARDLLVELIPLLRRMYDEEEYLEEDSYSYYPEAYPAMGGHDDDNDPEQDPDEDLDEETTS